jgi:hypothetical protein
MCGHLNSPMGLCLMTPSVFSSVASLIRYSISGLCNRGISPPQASCKTVFFLVLVFLVHLFRIVSSCRSKICLSATQLYKIMEERSAASKPTLLTSSFDSGPAVRSLAASTVPRSERTVGHSGVLISTLMELW